MLRFPRRLWYSLCTEADTELLLLLARRLVLSILCTSKCVFCDTGKLDEQRVVSVRDRYLGTQAWYNEVRSSKPLTFAADAVSDPTSSSGACDFCQWREMTAEDTWGRYVTHTVYQTCQGSFVSQTG